MVRSILTGSYGEVKEKVNQEILLEDPTPVLEQPIPRPETEQTNEDAQSVTDREARDKLAQDRVLLENEETRERGRKVGHNVFFYNEVQKRLIFLALDTEGKENVLSRKTHIWKYLSLGFENW